VLRLAAGNHRQCRGDVAEETATLPVERGADGSVEADAGIKKVPVAEVAYVHG
jgi:hypothetical protein